MLVSEDVATQRTLKLTFSGVCTEVSLTHHIRLEPPRASWESTGKRSAEVMNSFVFIQRRLVSVSKPTNIANNAVFIVELPVSMDGGIYGRRKFALTAFVRFFLVRALMGNQVGTRLKALVTHLTKKHGIGPVDLHVFAQIS